MNKIEYLNDGRTARTEILSENVEKYRQQGFAILVLVRNDPISRVESPDATWYELGDSSVEDVRKQFPGKALSFFKLYGEIVTQKSAPATTLKDWWEAIIDHPFKK